mgnify:CR=1 FL=1
MKKTIFLFVLIFAMSIGVFALDNTRHSLPMTIQTKTLMRQYPFPPVTQLSGTSDLNSIRSNSRLPQVTSKKFLLLFQKRILTAKVI